MQTVRDESGTRYLLVKRSGESSRVRDPRTGEERYVPNDALELTAESALLAAGRAVPADVRRKLGTISDERTLGLLGEISVREPVGVLTLLDSYDLCESDLHGSLGELQAGGLIEPAKLDDFALAGDRGYRTTEETRAAFSSGPRTE